MLLSCKVKVYDAIYFNKFKVILPLELLSNFPCTPCRTIIHMSTISLYLPVGLVIITESLPPAIFFFFCHSTLGTYNWHPASISYYSNEQCYTPPRKGWRIWVWVSWWQGLCQFFLLLWGLSNGSMEAWKNTYPHCQNGLLCPHLLPNCLLFV